MCLECMMDVSFIPVTNITNEYLKRQIAIWRKTIVFLEKKLNKQNYNRYLKYLNYWNFSIANFFASKYVLSLRTADAFRSSLLSLRYLFGGREKMTGNASAVRRLVRTSSKVTFITDRSDFGLRIFTSVEPISYSACHPASLKKGRRELLVYVM